uniref:Uncharacterized protein n=1 Tax=Oryza sativa subsp. japonica TaxID=39947 RepID=Q6H842_ORYSJ|nr:hypothetical protein [Oryza sativa Japonica Group]BAD25107.1 hypothetical protein [Oryza sativa Japonica Group]
MEYIYEDGLPTAQHQQGPTQPCFVTLPFSLSPTLRRRRPCRAAAERRRKTRRWAAQARRKAAGLPGRRRLLQGQRATAFLNFLRMPVCAGFRVWTSNARGVFVEMPLKVVARSTH